MPRACALNTVATSESAVLDRRRFKSLWARARTDHRCDGAGAVYEELVRLYSDASRHYHTPEHIAHCLRQFDAASPYMDEPDAVELALWFHDVIYDIHADDNELRSAELFERLAGITMSPEFKQRVHDLIMVTTHDGFPGTADERFMVDIDLSSFGLPWDEFARDSAAVRAEFGHVPDERFYSRQRDFMRKLLSRPSFCFTDFFRARHEDQARENIRRTIEHIDALC